MQFKEMSLDCNDGLKLFAVVARADCGRQSKDLPRHFDAWQKETRKEAVAWHPLKQVTSELKQTRQMPKDF